MGLGEKTTVLRFQRKPLRGKYLNAPKVYRKMIHVHVNVRTCPFDSHMCSIVSLYMFYSMNVLVDLDKSGHRTNSD